MINKASFILVCSLLIFLPFSSWLISLTGQPEVGLIRDILVLVLFIISIAGLRKKLIHPLFVLASSLVVWGLLSFLWREANTLQWLKGFRGDLVPILFFISILATNFSEQQKQKVLNIAIISSVFFALAAILELSGLRLPLTTSFSGPGALEPVHYVGESGISRIQSVLAGPNALGLYLLAILSILFIKIKTMRLVRIYASLLALLLVLTYSRSAWSGLFVLLLGAAALWLHKIGFGLKKIILIFAILIIVLLSSLFVFYKNTAVRQIITHGDSSSLRLEQYRRVWDSKFEIGLLGRGAGGSGPSTQNRLDEGPNRWTENTFIDMFETYGLMGLLLHLVLSLYLLVELLRKRTAISVSAILLLVSMTVSGLFINYYTGQVSLYIMWLLAGMALSGRSENLKNKGVV